MTIDQLTRIIVMILIEAIPIVELCEWIKRIILCCDPNFFNIAGFVHAKLLSHELEGLSSIARLIVLTETPKKSAISEVA